MNSSTNPVNRSADDQPAQSSGFTGCLLRLFWMLGGNGVLFFSTYFIADRPAPFLDLTWRDAVYWAAAAALAAARSLDVLRLGGRTATGEPATPAHLKKYLAGLAIAALCAWCLAHGIASLRAA